MPKKLSQAPGGGVLASVVLLGLCSSAVGADRSLGTLIHACRALTSAGSGVVLRIGLTPGAEVRSPSLQMLCAPRPDRTPATVFDRAPWDERPQTL